MKRPSFQFYPGDWSSNPNLKRCTFAEKGVWLEVMCLMHDQAEYGVLRWPLKEIAEAVKCKPAELQALQRKGVLKGHDEQLDEPFVYTPRSGRRDGEPVTLVATQAGPVWYSSRMVKDEYVRLARGDGDGKGAAPKNPPKPSPKGGIGEGFGPRGSSSSSSPSGKEQGTGPFTRQGADLELVGHQPTPAGAVCRALRLAGIGNTNPGHPTLQLLLDAGATTAEFTGAAEKARDKHDPFAYVLSTVEGQRRDAASRAAGLHRGPLPTAADTTAEQRAATTAEAARLLGFANPQETIDG